MTTPRRLTLYGTMSRPLAGGISLGVIAGFFPDNWLASTFAAWPLQILSIGLKTVIDIVTCVLLFGLLVLVEQLATVFFANRTFDHTRVLVTLPVLMTAWLTANAAVRIAVKMLLSRELDPRR